MRLLHTADWHLGKRLHGIDRLEEAQAVLAELAELAAAERVDAVLVAGDLLDRRLIEPQVLAACLRALEDLASVAPVVAVTGNHDDPAFWAELAPYLAPRIAMVAEPGSPDEATVTLETRNGLLHVAALPWPDPGGTPVTAGATVAHAGGLHLAEVTARIDALDEELRDRRRAAGGATALVAHLMVDRALAGGGERALTLGSAWAFPGPALPGGADYVALGHVHRPQGVAGRPGAAYSGSPMALDFSDEGQARGATLVEIGPGGGATRALAAEAGRRLVRIRGRLDELSALAAEHPDAWFLCEVELEDAPLDLVREVRERVPDALRVEPVAAASPALPGPGGGDGPDAADLGELYAAWRGSVGRPADEGLIGAFRTVLARAERGGDG